MKNILLRYYREEIISKIDTKHTVHGAICEFIMYGTVRLIIVPDILLQPRSFDLPNPFLVSTSMKATHAVTSSRYVEVRSS